MVKRLFKRYIDLLGFSTFDNLGLPHVVNLTMKRGWFRYPVKSRIRLIIG